MVNIQTLVPDIYARLDSSEPFDPKLVEGFAHNLAKKLTDRLSEERVATKLRLSNWDTKCERQLWLKINRPETVETLPPNVKLKFIYGDVLEELILFLAAAAGHKVEGEQDTLSIAGVEGHRDGIIDGHLVDAKSASPYGFKKFAGHTLGSDDAFGYIGQLGSYLAASHDDERVIDKASASFLAINKVSGELALDTHEFKDSDVSQGIEQKKKMLAGAMPNRSYDEEPMGKSGNYKLGVACSYCPVRRHCWPGLRSFGYSSGVVHLSRVVEEPKVPEILGVPDTD